MTVSWKIVMNEFGSELATTWPEPTTIVSTPRMM